MTKPRHLQPALLALAAFAAAMLVAPAAHAFTYETKSYTDDKGLPPGYTDPDKKVEQFGSGSVPGEKGDTTFRFEAGPSNSIFGGPAKDRFGPAGQFIPMPGTIPNNR